jgi:hypothetical protein
MGDMIERMRRQYPELRQAANGYWYIWYDRLDRESLKTKDKRIATITFNTKKREKRDQKVRALTAESELNLGDFIKEYAKLRAGDKRPATVAMDELALGRLLSYVGNIPLSRISEKDIDNFHAFLLRPQVIKTPKGKEKTKKGCEKTTINVYIRHLKVAFKKAMRWGHLAKNPYQDVQQFTTDDKKRPI